MIAPTVMPTLVIPVIPQVDVIFLRGVVGRQVEGQFYVVRAWFMGHLPDNTPQPVIESIELR